MLKNNPELVQEIKEDLAIIREIADDAVVGMNPSYRRALRRSRIERELVRLYCGMRQADIRGKQMVQTQQMLAEMLKESMKPAIQPLFTPPGPVGLVWKIGDPIPPPTPKPTTKDTDANTETKGGCTGHE